MLLEVLIECNSSSTWYILVRLSYVASALYRKLPATSEIKKTQKDDLYHMARGHI